MKNYPVKEVVVGLKFSDDIITVGRLAIRELQIYFQFDPAFLKLGLQISPLKLPLESRLKKFDPFLFEGLPGVFNDSLPDGWGRLLYDRFVRRLNISPKELSSLDRLAHIGINGMGALVYQPDFSVNKYQNNLDLEQIFQSTQIIIKGESSEVLQELITLNGSSAGARPKALIGVNNHHNIIYGSDDFSNGYKPWIVKFANNNDGLDSGSIEYVYSLMAKDAGIEMTDTFLFPSRTCGGFFGTKRFDNDGKNRMHTHTVSGLLHSDFRVPSLDYEDLLALTGWLTKDIQEVQKMFKLAVFNILSHNRDDHSKNFSFLMSKNGDWTLAPAYDITFSYGPGGEQSTMVKGEGKNPTIQHIVKLGESAKLESKFIKQAIDMTKESLSKWHSLAKEYDIKSEKIKLISEKHIV